MRNIRVIDVGDGACSVVRDRWHPRLCREMTIIDCGSGSGAGRSAASGLFGDVHWDLRRLTSIVVTHYDADHWRGLEYFALKFAATCMQPTIDELPIYSPAVPARLSPDVLAGVAALISATATAGVQAGDLQAAWNKVVPTRIRPSRDGDVIGVAGRRHRVVWPPAQLSEPDAAYADRILADIVDLAEKSPRLKQALKDAYGSAIFRPREEVRSDLADRPEFDDGGESDQPIMSDVVESEVNSQDSTDDRAELPDDRDRAEYDDADSPQKLLRENRKLVRRARALQNYLSLVFYDQELGSLVCYGDAPPAVVDHVNTRIPSHFAVMLAPHHGTQLSPPNMPSAQTCVAQGGAPKYRTNWFKNHVPHHSPGTPCAHLADIAGGVLERWVR